MKVAIIYNSDITGVINNFGMQNKEFYDIKTVKKVASCLEQAGHNVRILDGNMYIVERLQNFFPTVIDNEQMGMVFNMAYGIQGESRYTHIPSMLEMLGIPYVGSTPAGHALALDKVMTKIVWQKHTLPTPDFWVFNNAGESMDSVRFPVIVKPKMESVSFGLKVVYNVDDLQEAVHFITSEFLQQALVEQFIPGREFCVGILGNSPVESFPILEIDLSGDPNAIQTAEDKKERPRQKICPANISEELAEKMRKYSIEAFHALGLRDFARVDIRLDEQGEIYLLEINSMASLGETGSYPTAARVAGYDFGKLVNKMLDVATVRYFSTPSNIETDRKLSLNSRLRTFLRGRQQNSEKLLRNLVSTNTYVRNVEGINSSAERVKSELAALGFAHEIFPQLEVGNMYYFSNCYNKKLDYLILLSLDDNLEMHDQEGWSESEHRLYGTGIWENKGGIVTTIMALQALRYSKHLKKLKIGIFLATDTSVSGKFSKTLINQKAGNAKAILGLHGGNMNGSLVSSRSGSALYYYNVKLTDHSNAETVSEISRYFHRAIANIADLSINDKGSVVAPGKVDFNSNIFKVFAHGKSNISVRFNTREEFDILDTKIRKAVKLPSSLKNKAAMHIEGGISRPPFLQNEVSLNLYNQLCTIAKKVDVQVSSEHRWSSSDICNVAEDIPAIDGIGPIGGYDRQKSEYIQRHSLIDRALILAILLMEQ